MGADRGRSSNYLRYHPPREGVNAGEARERVNCMWRTFAQFRHLSSRRSLSKTSTLSCAHPALPVGKAVEKLVLGAKKVANPLTSYVTGLE
jgi:hypothetical protein